MEIKLATYCAFITVTFIFGKLSMNHLKKHKEMLTITFFMVLAMFRLEA